MTINLEAMKVAASLNKRFKRDVVILGSAMQPVTRITSGSLSLDVVLGGGWPVNRWIEVVGDPSNGKTACLLKTLAANQATDPLFTCVWVAAEDYDKIWAATLGVDNDRVILIESNIMEEAYQAVLDFLDSKTIDMVVIDSLPALVTIAEDDKMMDENTVGRNALMTNKFFRKALSATKREPDGSERGVTCFIVNQWRERIGVVYGDPRTTPGGKGKDYSYSIKVEVKRDEWIEEGTGDAKHKVGLRLAFRSTKNKTAPLGSKAFVDFFFEDCLVASKGEYDYAKEIVALSILHGVVDRRGGWFYYRERKWQGATSLLDDLRGELDLKEELEREVLLVVRAETGTLLRSSFSTAEPLVLEGAGSSEE